MTVRGPDGAGLWLAPDRRLDIIELSDAAAQPMASADGRDQFVFNAR